MTETERVAILALMTRIEAKVDHVLEQLDGLLAVCERLEDQMATVKRSEEAGREGRTVH